MPDWVASIGTLNINHRLAPPFKMWETRVEIVLLRRTNPIGNMVGENANRSKGEKQEISSKMLTVQKDGNKISDRIALNP